MERLSDVQSQPFGCLTRLSDVQSQPFGSLTNDKEPSDRELRILFNNLEKLGMNKDVVQYHNILFNNYIAPIHPQIYTMNEVSKELNFDLADLPTNIFRQLNSNVINILKNIEKNKSVKKYEEEKEENMNNMMSKFQSELQHMNKSFNNSNNDIKNDVYKTLVTEALEDCNNFQTSITNPCYDVIDGLSNLNKNDLDMTPLPINDPSQYQTMYHQNKLTY